MRVLADVTPMSYLLPPRVWQFVSAVLFSGIAIMVRPTLLGPSPGSTPLCVWGWGGEGVPFLPHKLLPIPSVLWSVIPTPFSWEPHTLCPVMEG